MAQNRDKRRNESGANDDLDERVVFVNRCAKTVKGGRRMSFSAVVVVGDHEGKVGVGFGKANEVSDAIRKGGDAARKAMRPVVLHGKTIPHDVTGTCDGGREGEGHHHRGRGSRRQSLHWTRRGHRRIRSGRRNQDQRQTREGG